jgi:hypothetical protein
MKTISPYILCLRGYYAYVSLIHLASTALRCAVEALVLCSLAKVTLSLHRLGSTGVSFYDIFHGSGLLQTH